mmetsp:Transcript_2656/g.4409  ORF Transcript_2656/g.4409 Transcript_2656/m.4409 type:complete len:357 (-) Transcript_2656:2284-3354(-)
MSSDLSSNCTNRELASWPMTMLSVSNPSVSRGKTIQGSGVESFMVSNCSWGSTGKEAIGFTTPAPVCATKVKKLDRGNFSMPPLGASTTVARAPPDSHKSLRIATVRGALSANGSIRASITSCECEASAAVGGMLTVRSGACSAIWSSPRLARWVCAYSPTIGVRPRVSAKLSGTLCFLSKETILLVLLFLSKLTNRDISDSESPALMSSSRSLPLPTSADPVAGGNKRSTLSASVNHGPRSRLSSSDSDKSVTCVSNASRSCSTDPPAWRQSLGNAVTDALERGIMAIRTPSGCVSAYWKKARSVSLATASSERCSHSVNGAVWALNASSYQKYLMSDCQAPAESVGTKVDAFVP